MSFCDIKYNRNIIGEINGENLYGKNFKLF